MPHRNVMLPDGTRKSVSSLSGDLWSCVHDVLVCGCCATVCESFLYRLFAVKSML